MADFEELNFSYLGLLSRSNLFALTTERTQERPPRRDDAADSCVLSVASVTLRDAERTMLAPALRLRTRRFSARQRLCTSAA